MVHCLSVSSSPRIQTIWKRANAQRKEVRRQRRSARLVPAHTVVGIFDHLSECHHNRVLHEILSIFPRPVVH
jgi:histone acetyltransferase (RNA polymerase elongator complex component)